MRGRASGFDLLSAETNPWWLEEHEVEGKLKQTRRACPRPAYMTSKLQELSAALDGLDTACREARDFASPSRVSYDIFTFILL